MDSNDRLLLRALRRETLPRPPVWLMRQAGRYLPEYQVVRKQAGGFLQLVKNPELSAEVTLQPIRRYGLDASIVFSDILVPLEAMGMELVFDERGPSFPEPLRTARDVESLLPLDPAESLAYVGETLERVRAGLPDEVALIGFCGAPFTLASYAIEGGTGRAFLELRAFMYRQTAAFDALMDKLAEAVGRHLVYQVEHGAEVVMLFDTWAGSLTPEDYRRFALPWARKALEYVGDRVPRLVFVHGGGHLLDEVAGLPCEGLALDHRIPIGAAFDRYGDRLALMGNLDPAVLLSTPEDVARRTRAILDAVHGRPGHVLNLGHGVLKTTDPANVATFVEAGRA